MPIIIKTAGVSTYGAFTLIITIATVINGLSSFGVGTSSFRYLPSLTEKEDKARHFFPPFYFKLFVLLLISLVILFIEPIFVNLTIESGIHFSIYILPVFLISYHLYEYSHKYLRYTSRIFAMSLITVIYSYAHVLLVIILSKKIILDINVLLFSQSIILILVSILVFMRIFKEINISFSFFNYLEIKKQIKIGFPLVLNFIVDFILASSDRLLISYFLGVYCVGLYVPAYTLGSLILLVPKAIGTVVPQLMSRCIDKNDINGAKELFINSIKVFLAIVIPFIFGIYMIGYEGLLILSNQDVAQQGQYVALIVASSGIFYGLNILISQVFMVELKTKIIFKANVFAAIFNLGSNFVFLSIYPSLYTAAITTLLSFFISSLYFIRSLNRNWWDKSLFLYIIKIFFLSCVMFSSAELMVYMIKNFSMEISSLILLLIKVLVSISIYSILIWKFKLVEIKA